MMKSGRSSARAENLTASHTSASMAPEEDVTGVLERYHNAEPWSKEKAMVARMTQTVLSDTPNRLTASLA